MSDDMREWLAKLKAQGHGDGWVVGVDVAEASGDKTAVIVSADSEESLNEALEFMRQNGGVMGSIIHSGVYCVREVRVPIDDLREEMRDE